MEGFATKMNCEPSARCSHRRIGINPRNHHPTMVIIVITLRHSSILIVKVKVKLRIMPNPCPTKYFVSIINI